MASPKIFHFDLTASPTTEVQVTLPKNTWMVVVVGMDIGYSSADGPLVRLDEISSASYKRLYMTTTADNVDTITGMSANSSTSASGVSFTNHIYGPMIAAPTAFIGKPLDIPSNVFQLSNGIQTAATAHSTLEVVSISGNTMNAGDIWIVCHRRNNSLIEAHDFGSSALASKDFAIGSANSVVLLSSDLTLASSSDLRIRTDQDAGATDYYEGYINRATSSGQLDTFVAAPHRGSTTNAFFSIFEGCQLEMPTAAIMAGSIAAGNTTPFHSMGIRRANAVVDDITLTTPGGVILMNGGTAYCYGAA